MIHCGDCLEVMATLEANSIDSIVTDPPYGLEFMGKEWDKLGRINSGRSRIENELTAISRGPESYRAGKPMQSWHYRWAVEALRVAKPGAILMAFGGTRTFHRLACAIEDAGWEIRDTIMWVYGSGFPKSHDISKGIDKIVNRQEFETRLGRNATREELRVAWAYFRPPIGDMDDPRYQSRSSGIGVIQKDTTTTFGKFEPGQIKKTAPATDAAKLWNGWGTALKPAWEPIIVAMKPLDGTFAENAQKWGVAGLWIDGGRIPTNGDSTNTRKDKSGGCEFFMNGDKRGITEWTGNQGRWPANLIHDGSDEVLARFPDTLSGSKPGHIGKHNINFKSIIMENAYGDSGSAARFFKQCQFTQEDLCEIANTAENSLNQLNLVGDFVLNLVAIEQSQGDRQLGDSLRPFMNEMRRQLRESSEIDMQRMMNLGIKCLQELSRIITERLKDNPVKSAEIKEPINTIQIIQNLLNIDGFVEAVISDSMLLNMVLGEKGCVSRFKYCAKASRAEREMGLEGMENRSKAVQYGDGLNSATKIRTEEQAETGVNRGSTKNHHPTVKPLALMRYLVRICKTPTGGIVLDPFMGSGTTGMACKLEGREFIGIDNNKEYCEIAEKRIAAINYQPEIQELRV